jgi:transcriptional regulator with XRE-family HTH domain
MVNNADFAERLQKIIDYYDESASSFAEKIGVQRSSISHVLSGRNKPSLDFIMKILKCYPEVNLYWLLNGSQEFLTPHKTPEKPVQPPRHVPPPQQKKPNQDIEKIVIFYKDGSFKSYE